MRFLQQASIQRKQMVVIMLTCTAALLLASIAFITYEAYRFRGDLERNIDTLAEVFGNNSVAALEFDDGQVAQEVLSAIRAEENIVSAVVYNDQGHAFSRFERQ